MKRILVVTILLAALALSVSASAVEKLYFADNGNKDILRCDPDGSNIEVLISTGLENVANIAIHRTAGKMFWTEWPSAGARIRCANLDGSNVENVITGLSGPAGIALDVPSGKMYFTEFSIDKIKRANLDGSNIEELVTTGLTHIIDIALDLGSGKMYWVDGASQYTAKVERSNLDGSGREVLVPVGAGLIAPNEIALDLSAGKMYWTDLGVDSLFRSNLDGSSMEKILPSEFGTPVGLALDLDAGKLYFSDYGSTSEIKRANLDGTGVETIISSGIGACYGLAFGPAEAECGDIWLNGPWLVVVTGVEVYDYAVYLVFDGQGTIDEMGSFNVPDSAGSYVVEPDCDMTGYLWSDGYAPFTGQIDSDTTAQMDFGGGPMALLKVRDVGALEGCWSGTFVQDVTGTIFNITLAIDDTGSIVSSTGFTPPVSGKFFSESGYLAGYMQTGEVSTPWEEIVLLDATTSGDTAMTGTFGLDCDCPGGTFYMFICPPTGAQDRTVARSAVLHPNYPNPFNPRTTIAYSISEPGRVSLRIYDTAGRVVKTLVDANKGAGTHTKSWAGQDNHGIEVSSGVYFVRLEFGGEIRTNKIVLLK